MRHASLVDGFNRTDFTAFDRHVLGSFHAEKARVFDSVVTCPHPHQAPSLSLKMSFLFHS